MSDAGNCSAVVTMPNVADEVGANHETKQVNQLTLDGTVEDHLSQQYVGV